MMDRSVDDDNEELTGGGNYSKKRSWNWIWGTWEELLLGGAVLRHGTHSWHAVASELRLRAPSSSPLLTPLECQVKYEDILHHYYHGSGSGSGSSSSSSSSSSSAWFEELQKRRVAELKRELAKSEDSIGSLQSEIQSLTSQRETDSNFGHNTSNAQSTSPLEDVDGIDFSTKQVSRDESSAGSFTDKSGKDWTNKCQNNASVSLQQNDLKMRCFEDFSYGCGCLGIGFRIFRKKRGKRKRKGCNTRKEGGAEDNDMLSSAALVNREESADGCAYDPKLSSEDSGGTWMGEGDAHLDLAKVMDLIMKHEDISIFRFRPKSEKRARYEKMIRRHVDFRNIRSRIADGSISSVEELFRDLLLLCNNALVFYPKNSIEHKSAVILRDSVNKALRQRFNSQSPICSCSDGEDAVPKKILKPKKIRSALQHRIAKNAVVDGERDATPPSEKTAVPVGVEGTPPKGKGNKGPRADVAVRKRGIERSVAKGGQRGSVRPKESPNKRRKRV